MRRQVVFVLILTGAVAIAAFVWLRSRPRPTNDMKALAERYVRLVLALGQHDPAFVDAYYGPAEWRVEAQHAKVPLTEVDAAATDLASDLDVIAPPASADELVRWRHAYVARQLEALRARVAMVRGTRPPK